MEIPKLPKNELDRLKTLESYQILDTTSEEEFDNLTKLAAEICDTPISLITFLDESRQWFKSTYGISEKQTPRDISFCGHAILDSEIFEVEDALLDNRFKDNPLVTADPNIRFYAGIPLETSNGSHLGTLCVIDSQPRKLNLTQRKSLYRIAKQVVSLLEHRKALIEIATLSKALEESHIFHDTLLNSADETIVSTTTDGIITTFNRGAEEMLGYAAEEVIGRFTPAIFHDADEVESYAKELSLQIGTPVEPSFEVFVLKARLEGADSRRWTYIHKDGSRITVNLSITPILDYENTLVGYLGIARDMTTAIETQNALIEISSIMERTGELAKVGGWELNLLDNDIKWTKQVFKIHEIEASTPPPLEDALSFYPPEERTVVIETINKCIETGLPWDMELPFITAKGNHIWVRSQGALNTINGQAVSLVGTFQDITERKKADINLEWLNRALHMLSKTNHALAQISEEKTLIIEICRIAVDIGGYRMAWVGYAENDEYKTVSPQAYFGHSSEGYIDEIKLSWSENVKIGNGPAGKSIRTGKAIVVEDILLDSSFPVHELAAKYEYRSIVAIPLKNNQNVFGMLALYSNEARNFATQELALLQELVDNLSSGINNILIQRDSSRLNEAIVKVASSITTNDSSDFFKKILSSITDTLRADAGYIAKLLPEIPLKGSMLAISRDSEYEDNFEFVISDKTLKALFNENALILVSQNAHKKFPELSMMRFHPFEAFAGLHLSDINGNNIGLVFVFFKESLDSKYSKVIESILKIFAARITSELERLHNDLIIQEQASMLEKTRDAIVVRDINQKITFWNKGAEELYGWTSEEVLNQSIQNILKQDSEVLNDALKILFETGEWVGEIAEYDKNGNKLIVEGHWTLLMDTEGKPKSIFAIKTDITQRKLEEEQTRTLAFYDPLTALPNRRLLIDRLKKAISTKKRENQFGAIFFLDLDNFKKLNDTLGHDVGDQLLKEVSERLTESVRACDTVSRLGGDEFVILVDNLTTEIDHAKAIANQIGDKILKALNHPFTFNGHIHSCTPSIGISFFNHDSHTPDQILKNADIAMYKSKTTGRNKLTFFDKDDAVN